MLITHQIFLCLWLKRRILVFQLHVLVCLFYGQEDLALFVFLGLIVVLASAPLCESVSI